jgi:hypothetical protein
MTEYSFFPESSFSHPSIPLDARLEGFRDIQPRWAFRAVEDSSLFTNFLLWKIVSKDPKCYEVRIVVHHRKIDEPKMTYDEIESTSTPMLLA